MNHWFLVSRDIMWVILAVAPMVLWGYFCVCCENDEGHFVAGILGCIAVVIQGLWILSAVGGLFK